MMFSEDHTIFPAYNLILILLLLHLLRFIILSHVSSFPTSSAICKNLALVHAGD